MEKAITLATRGLVMEESVVVIGAGGGLGSALVEHWLAAGAAPVIAVSRQPQPAELNSSRLHWLRCDYSDEQLAPRPRWLVICNGLLQQGGIRPEKRLEALNLEVMTQLYQTNALLPLRWISQLLPLLGSSPVPWRCSAPGSAASATTAPGAGMAIAPPRRPSTCC